MRKAPYYGQALGAIVIELRRGHTSSVIVGRVHRYTAEEQAMGSPTLKFTPAREITGKITVRALAADLAAARRTFNDANVDARFEALAAVDRVVAPVLED